jgi:hypothetical protein
MPFLLHTGEQIVQVIRPAHHARGEVERDGVSEGAQPRRRRDRLVESVLRRAGHRQADALGQLGGLGLALSEREDLEVDRVDHRSPSTSGVPYVWKLSIVCTPQNWPRARSSRSR